MDVIPGLSRLVAWIIAAWSGAEVCYHAAILSGILKHPIMAQFRRYGEERNYSPICWFAVWSGIWLIASAILIRSVLPPTHYVAQLFPPNALFMLALGAFATFFAVNNRPALRVALPSWYQHLLQYTSRQERRQLGFAWLRISRRLRWRLSGDQASFRVWAELVRLTVIYGAYDPDDPWDHWT